MSRTAADGAPGGTADASGSPPPSTGGPGCAKTWVVTGGGRGLGRLWATAALARGDRVGVGVRDPEAVADLSERFPDTALPLRWDVDEREQAFEAVARVQERFGGVDVLVNGAGHTQAGPVEELAEEELLGQLRTNLLGAVWATQAVLPVMRRQGAGRVLQVSSVRAVVPSPFTGAYAASKAALEALSDSLALEVADHGITVTILQLGPFATGASTTSMRTTSSVGAYAQLADRVQQVARQAGPPEDPERTTDAVLAVADDPHPRRRVLLGRGTADAVLAEQAARREERVS